MKYCINELDYISSNIFKGIRPDLRSFKTEREVLYTRMENTHSDGALEVRQGYSHIRINLQFNLEGVTSNYDIPSFFDIPLPVSIHLEVYRDDGNIRDMFYNGLGFLFREIEVPDISEKSLESKIIQVDLPRSSTFGIFKCSDIHKSNNKFYIIKDPIKLEEESCEALLTVFKKGSEVVSIQTYKCGEISEDIVKEILNMV